MKSIFAFTVLFFSFAGFSQSPIDPQAKSLSKDCVLFRPSLFDKPVPAEMPATTFGLGKIEFCNDIAAANLKMKYRPVVYDWAAISQKIEDYKSLYPKQDANGRDLMLDVITNEMTDRLLSRILPH